MRNTLVSVVMPAYNDAPYVAQAIDSVLAQTWSHIELIVVDDGSTDGTRDVVRSYGGRLCLVEQTNAGSAVARNRGIELAQGRYVAFLDADDWWHPEKLASQMQALQRQVEQGGPEARMVYTRFERWNLDEKGCYAPPASLLPDCLSNAPPPAQQLAWIYPELLEDCIVWTSTVMVERQLLLDEGGFDPARRKGQDYDLWLRLSQRAPWLLLDVPSALYRIRAGSITHVPKPVNDEYEILRRATERWGMSSPDGRQGDAKKLRARMARSCTNFGLIHLGGGDPRLAIQAFRQAIDEGGLTASRILLLARAWVKVLQR